MRKTASSKLTPEEELFLQMEEPPEILAEGALDEFAPEPAVKRLESFLQGAIRADLIEPAKKAGDFKKGRRTFRPARMLEDFAGTSAEVVEFRKFLRECSGGAAASRARVAPLIDAKAAEEALGKKPKLEHLRVLVGLVEISARYYAEKQLVTAFVVDVAKGSLRPEFVESLPLLPGAEAEPLPAKEASSKKLAKALEGLRNAAQERADGLYRLVRDEVARARADRRAAMEGYFEGLEEEYQREERRMYYHLYYFDQQEKLKAKRAADLVERQKLVAGQERYYQVETHVRLDALGLMDLPIWRIPRKILCGLSGRTL